MSEPSDRCIARVERVIGKCSAKKKLRSGRTAEENVEPGGSTLSVKIW